MVQQLRALVTLTAVERPKGNIAYSETQCQPPQQPGRRVGGHGTRLAANTSHKRRAIFGLCMSELLEYVPDPYSNLLESTIALKGRIPRECHQF